MTLVIILATILAAYFGLYWLISQEIRDHKFEILNKLKWIEKQNNMIREDINDLRIQIDELNVTEKKLRADERGYVDNIIQALEYFGKKQKISYTEEIEFLKEIKNW